MGINPKGLSKIFDQFFTTKKRGTGIGLEIVKNFLNDIGGEITVRPTLGVGTTFAVKFPVKAVDSENKRTIYNNQN